MSLAGVAALALSASALAQAPKVEGTPVPMQAKPDFSKVKYLMGGTWACVNLSSRRPGPFTVLTTYSMDPTGYWVLKKEVTQKASWIPRTFEADSKITYDAVNKRWVRITTDELGRYSVATSPDLTAFTYQIQTGSADIGSYAPEVYKKVSDTKRTMTTSFTEKSGRVVTVKETCTKT